MTIHKKHLNWLVAIFLFAIVAVVFQQIFTSMTEQGIASGGPYNNGAAYPAAVAVLLGVMVGVQFLVDVVTSKQDTESKRTAVKDLVLPVSLLAIFTTYLLLLGWLGYHLTTPVMVFSIIMLCGAKRPITTAAAAIVISISFAFLFEFFLKIVLPGGILGLNIPW